MEDALSSLEMLAGYERAPVPQEYVSRCGDETPDVLHTAGIRAEISAVAAGACLIRYELKIPENVRRKAEGRR